MTDRTIAPAPRVLRARKFVLIGSVAGLGLALVAGSQLPPNTLPAFTSTAHAQTAMRPASFADIVEKVKPAVFAVRVRTDNVAMTSPDGDEQSPFPPGSPMERFFKRFGFGDETPRRGRPGGRNFSMAQGSGFFISADGYAVTNNHVVNRGQTVEIVTDDGKTYQAKVIGTDPRTDLALLKTEGRNDFPFVAFADKQPRIGDWVLAVGNPFGLGGTVTAGIVSASGRDIGAGPYDDFIQIDAPVNRGNSGGPTFDVDGKVIGVNTAIYSPSGGNVGIAFAIPSETVRTVVAQLRDKGTVARGWIGVQIQPISAELAESLNLRNEQGALVAELAPNGPAAKAGLESGDVIVSVNGQPVKDARELSRRIGAQVPGETVTLGVMRRGAERSITLTLGTLPDEREARASTPDRGGRRDRDEGTNGLPGLGLSLAPASTVAGAGRDGVVVTEVAPNGAGAERGFRQGDVIVEVGGRPVSSPADVRGAMASARDEGRRSVLVRVRTGESTRFVALPVGRG